MFQQVVPLQSTNWRIIQADVVKYLSDYRHVARRGYLPKYHAVFCDPPYFLGSIVKRFGNKGAAEAQHGKDGAFNRLSRGFMGQQWDGFDSPQDYQAWVTNWAEMLLDFVYPGAVLVAFGGSRTYHRLVCGLEDAGWEIYDSIASWVYSTGFPKSRDLGEGYKTSLKPANEPIVIARAPKRGHTYQDCVDEFGTSALNIDACRIPTTDETSGRYPTNFILSHHPECNGHCHPDCHVQMLGAQSGFCKAGSSLSGSEPSSSGGKNAFGRWNRVAFEAYEDEGTAARFFYQAKAAQWEREIGLDEFPLIQSRSSYDKSLRDKHGNDSGYPRHNIHPTVKPIQLTEMLSRLILPPIEGARLLIPFSGSGSEMIGAHLAGWKDITGIEMTADYIPIAKSRMAWWTRFDSYAMAETAYKNKTNPAQMTLFEVVK